MINCDKCNKEIKDKKDLNVVALFGFKPTNMCNDCYAGKSRGITRGFYYPSKWFPLNSFGFTFMTIAITIVLLFFIFAFLFGNPTTSSSTASPLGGKIIFIALFLAVLIWQWALFFSARSRVNRV